MATISSSSGAQAAAQSGFQQLKVLDARRHAERAELIARSLEAQARNAQRVADRAQENARDLTVRSDQAHDDAGQARQGLALLSSVRQMQSSLFNVASQVVERLAAKDEAEGTAVAAPVAVVNTEGQLTGTLVSTTA